jgi:hypothetical protein
MIITIETVTPQTVLELSQFFSTSEINWLITRLKQLVENKTLPDKATLTAAIELFLGSTGNTEVSP